MLRTVHRPWREASPGDGPPILSSVTDDEAAALGRLGAGHDVLEVGSARGYSAVVMALAGARVTAVDTHSGQTWLGDTYAAMMAALEAYGVAGRVEILRGYSQDAMPELIAAGREFGLVFIDGDHEYHAVKSDVTHALQLLAPGGTIACHDYGEAGCPGVAQALDELFPAGPDALDGTLFQVTP